MPTRRTTVSAEADDLAVLQTEARRRGVPLAQLLREAVARQADELRADRKPRFGVGHGAPDLSQTSVDEEEAPAGERGRR